MDSLRFGLSQPSTHHAAFVFFFFLYCASGFSFLFLCFASRLNRITYVCIRFWRYFDMPDSHPASQPELNINNNKIHANRKRSLHNSEWLWWRGGTRRAEVGVIHRMAFQWLRVEMFIAKTDLFEFVRCPNARNDVTEWPSAKQYTKPHTCIVIRTRWFLICNMWMDEWTKYKKKIII